jgi:hypothetical protein
LFYFHTPVPFIGISLRLILQYTQLFYNLYSTGKRCIRDDEENYSYDCVIYDNDWMCKIARLANRSFLEKSWDHIWTHKLGYGLGALLVAGTYYLVSHSHKPKQQEALSQGNNLPAEQINLGADVNQDIAELNQHVAEHFAEDNIQLLAAAQNQIIQNQQLENVEIPHLPAP